MQLLSFNDFHGHLEASDPNFAGVPAGGVEYLASHVAALRAKQPDTTLTVAAGDLIGGSTFLSGLFQDQPSVEAMNELGLDVSSVGNHEFDEGTAELRRMVDGGCHPTIGCFKDLEGNAIPYGGADFDYLAANVVDKDTRKPFLPPYDVKTVDGVKVGFIGMTLEATDALVSPGGVATVDFLDEVQTANSYVAAAEEAGRGVDHRADPRGRLPDRHLQRLRRHLRADRHIARGLDPEIDLVVSGHTHQPYVCSIPDPKGDPRTGDQRRVVRAGAHRDAPDDRPQERPGHAGPLHQREPHRHARRPQGRRGDGMISFWKQISEPLAGRVVGTLAPNTDITGDSSTCRCEETPMTDLVADAMLWGTDGPDEGGAQIALMNTGGVRASLRYNQITNGEKPGEITYAETYAVAPFNNILVTVDLTGAQIEQVLNQQYQPISDRGSRPMLSLGVSQGFTYDWQWDGLRPRTPSPPCPATWCPGRWS